MKNKKAGPPRGSVDVERLELVLARLDLNGEALLDVVVAPLEPVGRRRRRFHADLGLVLVAGGLFGPDDGDAVLAGGGPLRGLGEQGKLPVLVGLAGGGHGLEAVVALGVEDDEGAPGRFALLEDLPVDGVQAAAGTAGTKQ